MSTDSASIESLWQQGWYQRATRLDSPNFGLRPTGATIDLIVLHAISLPPGQYGGTQVLQFFTNQLNLQDDSYFEQLADLRVSAHFFIRRSGEMLQFVSCDDRAWHAGVSSYRGRNNCNDDSIGIELEGLDGAKFETEQYACLCRLCSDLMQRYPIAHIAGHQHIAPGRKNDPGAGFDWKLLQKTMGLEDQYLPLVVRTQS